VRAVLEQCRDGGVDPGGVDVPVVVQVVELDAGDPEVGGVLQSSGGQWLARA
jgi:hypothetical protein